MKIPFLSKYLEKRKKKEEELLPDSSSNFRMCNKCRNLTSLRAKFETHKCNSCGKKEFHQWNRHRWQTYLCSSCFNEKDNRCILCGLVTKVTEEEYKKITKYIRRKRKHCQKIKYYFPNKISAYCEIEVKELEYNGDYAELRCDRCKDKWRDGIFNEENHKED